MSWGVAWVVGGVLGLDGTSFPQAMLSRPIAAGAIAGWIAGDPAQGVLIGAVLEAFYLAILPIGAARYPEAGTATAAATFAWAWAQPADATLGLLLIIAFALAWERITGGSVTLQRHLNHAILGARGGAGTAAGVEARHLLAMVADFARGGTVTLAGALAGVLWLRVIEPLSVLDGATAMGVVIAAAAGTAAAAMRVFGGLSARWRYFLAGLVVGALVLVVR
jgi:mannose/fructose/N-acetylgalactosamine-specific phosphotransferase system component IIC